jgi:hypothetical protein
MGGFPTFAPRLSDDKVTPKADTAPPGRGRRRLAETGLSIRSWALAGNAGRQLAARGAQGGDADNAPGNRFASADAEEWML